MSDLPQLSQRADVALSDLTSNGGILSPEQNDTFVRRLMDAPTMIRAIRTVPMNTPEMKINKIGLGSRILTAANQAGSANDSGSNARYVLNANRQKVTTSQVSLNTREVIAEIRIPYEVLEDNIEKGGMAETVLALIAERAALDLEELILLGDTASGDSYLALMNGVLKRVTSNVVDAQGSLVNVGLFNTLKKALPTKYRRNLRAMRFFSSMDRESDYRVTVAARGTGLGDTALTSLDTPIPVLGIPMVGVALLPNANVLLTDPQNIVFGVQRNVRIEQDRDIRSREVIIVLTARVALAIEEEEATAKVVNLG